MATFSSSIAEPLAPSIRYDRLVNTVEKALLESRNAFDTSEAVKECYGEDASIFAAAGRKGSNDGSTNMLAAVIDSMIVGINDKVKENMISNVQKGHVNERLSKVETLIQALDNADQQQREAEAQDRQSARSALDASKLPDGVTPSDMVIYHAFSISKEERDKLRAQIEAVEKDISNIEKKLATGKQLVDRRIKKLEDEEKQLENTAAKCSMVS